MLKSIFNKKIHLIKINLIKKRLQHRRFPVKFKKNFKDTFFYRTFPAAVSDTHNFGEVKNFPACVRYSEQTAIRCLLSIKQENL